MLTQIYLLIFAQIVVGIIYDKWFFEIFIACSSVQERAHINSKGFNFNSTSTNGQIINGNVAFKIKIALHADVPRLFPSSSLFFCCFIFLLREFTMQFSIERRNATMLFHVLDYMIDEDDII